MPGRLRFLERSLCFFVLVLVSIDCGSTPATALVLAIGTDLDAPDEYNTLQITAERNGAVVFQNQWMIPQDGTIPATLTFNDRDGEKASTPVRYEVVIGQNDLNKNTITRSAKLGFVDEKTKLLRINLERACIGISCTQGFTCVEGSCANEAVDPNKLPDFVSTDDAITQLDTPHSNGGTAGSSGSSSNGGAAGTGAGGTAGQAGTSATGGTGGTGGTSGSAGTAGTAGTGGGTFGNPVVGATQVSMGFDMGCVINATGSLRCWGKNVANRFGSTDSQFPDVFRIATPVSVPVALSSISVGNYHVCGISAGAVYCWGQNTRGQLGKAPSADVKPQNAVAVASISDAEEVVALQSATCVRRTTGVVSCWGAGELLGQGAGAPDSSVPLDVPGITNASALSSNAMPTACVLQATGDVTCWNSQVPTPTTLGTSDVFEVKTSPKGIWMIHGSAPNTTVGSINTVGGAPWPAEQQAPEYDGALHLATESSNYVCGVFGGNIVQCGMPTQPGIFPVVPDTPEESLDLAMTIADPERSSWAACARGQTSGAVTCWGDNATGLVGNGSPEIAPAPEVVVGATAEAISAGIKSTAIIDQSTTSLKAWGDQRALGVNANQPLQAGGFGQGYSQIRLSGFTDNFAYLLDASGTPTVIVNAMVTASNSTLATQGTGFNSLFGDDMVDVGTKGTQLIGLAKIPGSSALLGNAHTSVAAGETPTFTFASAIDGATYDYSSSSGCVWLADKTLNCWGGNNSDRFGADLGTPTIITLTGADPVKQACLGNTFLCAVSTLGNVFCRGTQWQTASATDSNNQLTAVTNAQGVACTARGACAWLSDGKVECWGQNTDGQIGVGERDDSALYAPTPALISDVAEISGGKTHYCAKHLDNTISCWGSNAWGQLGNGRNGQYPSAQAVLE